jgi:hypothetical protein
MKKACSLVSVWLFIILVSGLAAAKDRSAEYKTGTLVSWARDTEVKHKHIIVDYDVRRPVYKVILGESYYFLRPTTDIFPKDTDPLHYIAGKEFRYRLGEDHVYVEVVTVSKKGKERHDEADYFVMGVEPIEQK